MNPKFAWIDLWINKTTANGVGKTYNYPTRWSKSCTVWHGIGAGNIIGPYFLEDDKGTTQKIEGPGLEDMWYRQDGATSQNGYFEENAFWVWHIRQDPLISPGSIENQSLGRNCEHTNWHVVFRNAGQKLFYSFTRPQLPIKNISLYRLGDYIGIRLQIKISPFVLM